MTTENRQGLYSKQGLTPMDLAEIAQLAQLCNNEDGLDLKLNWETLRGRSKSESNDFLYYGTTQRRARRDPAQAYPHPAIHRRAHLYLRAGVCQTTHDHLRSLGI
jgi:hypothetical protein